MNAPVDYPLDVSTLLETLKGDELKLLSMLDRKEASAASNHREAEQSAKSRAGKPHGIRAKPPLIDAPMRPKTSNRSGSVANGRAFRSMARKLITKNSSAAAEVS